MENSTRARLLLLTAGAIGRELQSELTRLSIEPVGTADLLDRDDVSAEMIAGLLDATRPEVVAAALWRPYPRIISALNAELHRRGIIWTLGVVRETEIHIGPTFVPGKTACFACFLRRFYSNSPRRRVELPLAEYLDANPRAGHLGQLRAANRFAAGLLALEIQRLMDGHEATDCAFNWYELTDGSHGRHTILRAPGCTVCSTVDAREASVAHLGPALASFLSKKGIAHV